MQQNLTIDNLLQPFQRFGVHLGLERIKQLLIKLDNPHHHVPIIHVAGTNGKGSVCAYLSSILTEAGYKVGRYTSPHLVNWTERICINEQAISSNKLKSLILEIQEKINSESESPTQFEVITAAAWLYFAQEKVDIAVMEVGLGGRLDATNVSDHPIISIITSLSREHWQVLGPNLTDIAAEKAGILKKNCPAVVGTLPPLAKEVIAKKINDLNCPAIWVEPAIIDQGKTQQRWANYLGINYPLPLLGDIQLINSAIAIAAVQILQQQGWQIPLSAIQTGMRKTKWLGRLQWTTWNNQSLLIDGAHNPAAAIALRQYIDTLHQPVTWVIGMLAMKDHEEIFKALLRKDDHLYLVPVPDHTTADPEMLASLARKINPQLIHYQTFPELFTALEIAIQVKDRLIVLCGSLYLLGYFLTHK